MQVATTFDYASADIRGPQYWGALRELRDLGPVVWIPNGGYWAVTAYDAVVKVIQDWETFTSSKGVTLTRMGFDEVPNKVPIEIDPPRQRAYRMKVNPYLTIRALAHLEESIRDIANELIDPLIDVRTCDIALDFARKFPGTVFFRLIVGSNDEEFHLIEPWARMISFESNDPSRYAAASLELRDWAGRMFDARNGCPEIDDVVNAVMHLNETGPHDFRDHERMSGLQLLAQGGIGTSASAIGAVVVALCADPTLQGRVKDDPSLISNLVEEILRLEPPLPLQFRTANRDTELHGQKIKVGDRVGVFFGAANRDPSVFHQPDDILLDRPHRRHLAFGGGPHRCIGSNLARLQVRIAVEQLVARLAPFRLVEGAKVEYFSLQARGPSSIPIEAGIGPPNQGESR